MNLNKQILEAVKKGIQLALDDYQDIKPNSSISKDNDIINVDDVIQQRIELDKYTVDLGLPSGTRWCKFNMGCDFDLLNNYPEDTKSEDWYGGYFSWDEGTMKSKLNSEDLNIPISNNYNFYVPTKDQFNELIKYTTSKFVYNYIVNGKKIIGLNGIEFTGENGNNLFVPAAGYKVGNRLAYDMQERSYLWTSSFDINIGSPICYKNNDIRTFQYYYQLPIRPVINL